MVKLLSLPVCMAQGHVWGDSRQSPGWQTCRRCRMRRPDPWASDAQASAAARPAGPPVLERSRLRTIAVAARKGGSGKTTLAVHLALAAHLRGHKVVLADADPQRSAIESLSARTSHGPFLADAAAVDLAAVHARCESYGIGYLVIDTPGGPGPEARHAMALADLVLLTSRPNFLDIAAAVRTFAEARNLGRASLIVFTQAPPMRLGEENASVAKALEAMRFTNLPVSPDIVRARAAYQTCVAVGRSVEELGASAAADEMASLWGHVEAMLADERERERA